jgi:hypothetical protein
MASPVPYVVVLQTPAYGTLTWGPFRSRESAEAWVASGGHHPELLAAYETTTPAGMVVFVNPLYSTGR